MLRRTRQICFAILVAAPLLLTSGVFAQFGGELTFALRGEPKNLDPFEAVDEPSELVRHLSKTPLIRINRKTQQPEGQQMGMSNRLMFMGAAWICSLATLFAWPALFKTLLLYGLAARIPVVVITLLAVAFGWETHHVGLPPGAPEMTGLELAGFASLPQIGFWIPFTILVGGLLGGVGALLTRRRSTNVAAPEP